jgi:hypothetical protein
VAYSLAEHSKGPAGTFFQREQAAPDQSAVRPDPIRPETFTVESTGDRRRYRHHIFGIHEQPGGADHFRARSPGRFGAATNACASVSSSIKSGATLFLDVRSHVHPTRSKLQRRQLEHERQE